MDAAVSCIGSISLWRGGAGMSVSVGDIQLFMGPDQTGAPDNLKAPIVDFIDGAKKRLDIAVQELDSEDIGKAIVRAKLRKVQVRLVLESDYLRERKPIKFPWRASGAFEENRKIRDAILRSAIQVWSDFNTSIFHQKFMVRDGNAVLTGSTNFTETGTNANLNHIVIVKSRKVANIYAREFREIRQGHFGKLNEGHDPKPKQVEVSNVPVKVLFAPDHAPEMEIMKQMIKARERIDFAIFTFSQSSGIDDVMVRLAKTGFPIRGVFDAMSASQKWAASHLVKAAKIPIWAVRKGGTVGKLHHKLMIIDRQVIIAGSFNYTGPANLLNDENIIILGDLDSTSRSSIRAQRKLAGYAFDEIERIIRVHGARIR